MEYKKQIQPNEPIDVGASIKITDLITPIFKHIKLFTLITSIFISGAAWYSLSSPNHYKSSAVITRISNLENQNAGLASIATSLGLALPSSSGNDNFSLMLTLLSSRTLTNQVYEELKNDIMEDLYTEEWDYQSKRWHDISSKKNKFRDLITVLLSKHIKAVTNMDKSVITISAEFKNPDLAKKVVDAILLKLDAHLQKSDFTTAQRNKVFLEKQLLKNKRSLILGATELSNFYKRYDISNQSMLMEIDLKDSLTSNLSELELEKSVIDDIPAQIYLEYLNNHHNVLKVANSLLEQQYLQATIDAEKSKPGFNIVDKAEVPIKPSRPARAIILIVATMSGLFCSILSCFLWEYSQRNWASFKKDVKQSLSPSNVETIIAE